jgi:2-methylisocitrate lyase-like PEP mutase family enzyme
MKKTEQLRKLLEADDPLLMPGAFDALSGILIQRAGFKAIQATGFGIAASYLGKPDIGLLTFSEMLDQTRRIVQAVDIPVMADGDTGFGDVVNVIRTIREFETAGAAGINLEDQMFPKRCGHMEGKRVVPMGEMVGKIKAAADTRNDPDFIINARTDAIAVAGIDEAIRRGNAYAEAGADLIFVEAPQSLEQIRRIANEVKAYVSVNLFDGVKGGKTPVIPIHELKKIGITRVSIPVGVVFAAVKGMEQYLQALSDHGTMPDRSDLVCTFDHWKEVIGLGAIRENEEKYYKSK